MTLNDTKERLEAASSNLRKRQANVKILDAQLQADMEALAEAEMTFQTANAEYLAQKAYHALRDAQDALRADDCCEHDHPCLLYTSPSPRD